MQRTKRNLLLILKQFIKIDKRYTKRIMENLFDKNKFNINSLRNIRIPSEKLLIKARST